MYNFIPFDNNYDDGNNTYSLDNNKDAKHKSQKKVKVFNNIKKFDKRDDFLFSDYIWNNHTLIKNFICIYFLYFIE